MYFCSLSIFYAKSEQIKGKTHCSTQKASHQILKLIWHKAFIYTFIVKVDLSKHDQSCPTHHYDYYQVVSQAMSQPSLPEPHFS